MLGFENLKDMYTGDTDCGEDYEATENPILRDRTPWIDFMIQDGLLFKGNQLCILLTPKMKLPFRPSLGGYHNFQW
jgi:hypothetical protein